jgi:endonuclease YncB( thermonuclease family)
LEEGWAFLNHNVAKKSKYYDEYLKAENQAKAAKKNHWYVIDWIETFCF